jgi:hypothetical protein
VPDVDLLARIEAHDESIALLKALVRVLSDRLSRVEGHADKPARDALTTIKGASHASGYSETTIRKRIAEGRIVAHKIGGAVIVDAASVPRREKAS